MTDWIDINTETPKEHPTKTEWFEIRKDEVVVEYRVTFWDDDNNGTNGRFVNIGFGKEDNVTHWRRANDDDTT